MIPSLTEKLPSADEGLHSIIVLVCSMLNKTMLYHAKE